MKKYINRYFAISGLFIIAFLMFLFLCPVMWRLFPNVCWGNVMDYTGLFITSNFILSFLLILASWIAEGWNK